MSNVTPKPGDELRRSSSSECDPLDRRRHDDHLEERSSAPQSRWSQPLSLGSTLTRSRMLALIAVCTMSIGSHFAMYLLGPLKSRLHREMGTSNSQFSLLIAAFKHVPPSVLVWLTSSLNSTWTPLVAGLFVARFGTAWSSVITTGCILGGQAILLCGVTTERLIIMTVGLFVFGLGVTPLSVVQETLVSHLSPGHHLGLLLALGLVSGKSSSFVSSIVSLPLADRFGDAVPFTIAVLLCAGSFGANGARLLFGWGREVGEGRVKEKRMVSFGGIGELGDVFWAYILLNVLSGAIWSPFLHLSANLVQVRYKVTAEAAAMQASILLAGAMILYPIVGYLTDRFNPHTPRTTFLLLQLSSLLTLLAYSFLLLPPSWTQAPWAGMVLFTTGHGMATLLMVIVVPRFLPPAMVPLGLGLHKSMEMASSSMSQTLAGLWLDGAKAADRGAEAKAGAGLLGIFWMINALQLSCALLLARLEARRRNISAGGEVELAEEYESLPTDDGADIEEPNTNDEENDRDVQKREETRPQAPSSALARDEAEKRRGRMAFYASVGWIILVWTVFLGTAAHKL